MVDTRIQLKKTDTPIKRPLPSSLLEAELAVNVDNSEPGVYFATNTDQLVKVGSPYIGVNPPNFQGVGVNGGNPNYTQGELWWSPETGGLHINYNGSWIQIV